MFEANEEETEKEKKKIKLILNTQKLQKTNILTTANLS